MGAPLLALRGVGRRWRAGAGECTATVRALRGIDLVAHAGDIVAVTGARGAGKTTLLLCAAGIARPDEGAVTGEAVGRTIYLGGTHSWPRQAALALEDGTRALLLDVLDAPALASPRVVAAVAGRAASLGLAVLVAARDAAMLPAFATRLVTLAHGRIVASAPPLRSMRTRRRVVATETNTITAMMREGGRRARTPAT